MPRPKLIREIHELKYQLRNPRLPANEFIRIQQEYDSKVNNACMQHQCARVELLKALVTDFGRWVNEMELPYQYEAEPESD
jgi:hypothetical protein